MGVTRKKGQGEHKNTAAQESEKGGLGGRDYSLSPSGETNPRGDSRNGAPRRGEERLRGNSLED